MRVNISNFFRTHTKTSIVLLLIAGAGLGVIWVKVTPALINQAQAWQDQITAPLCTPLPFDDLYMTKKITFFVDERAKTHGNLSGCIPRKQGCADDESIWHPSDLFNVDQKYKDRFKRPLPPPITAAGLKAAMQSVFKRRNDLYSRAYSFDGMKFNACPIPDIEIVDFKKFNSTEVFSSSHKKIQVDIQPILLEQRSLYLVTFYVYQKEDIERGIRATDDWGTPWVVMENVKPEEIMFELEGRMPVSANLGGVDLGKYPNYFK